MGKHPLTGNHAKLYELWLKPNGIIGWLPEKPTIVVDNAAGTITWPKWRHLSKKSRPWDRDVAVRADFDPSLRPVPGGGSVGGIGAHAPVVDQATVPLVEPVTDRVRELARAVKLNLVER